jgi:DNA-directed RNA polymerase subunit RPC12/RpoP
LITFAARKFSCTALAACAASAPRPTCRQGWPSAQLRMARLYRIARFCSSAAAFTGDRSPAKRSANVLKVRALARAHVLTHTRWGKATSSGQKQKAEKSSTWRRVTRAFLLEKTSFSTPGGAFVPRQRCPAGCAATGRSTLSDRVASCGTRFEPMHDKRVVGQCAACGAPHDDYDNGPEQRCPGCRFLLLLCDPCRGGGAAGRINLFCGLPTCPTSTRPGVAFKAVSPPPESST